MEFLSATSEFRERCFYCIPIKHRFVKPAPHTTTQGPQRGYGRKQKGWLHPGETFHINRLCTRALVCPLHRADERPTDLAKAFQMPPDAARPVGMYDYLFLRITGKRDCPMQLVQIAFDAVGHLPHNEPQAKCARDLL